MTGLYRHPGSQLRRIGAPSLVSPSTATKVLDGVTYSLYWEDDFPGTTLNSDNWNKIEPDFIINSAKGGGGPVTQDGACWEENSGLEFWVDWIRVYKP